MPNLRKDEIDTPALVIEKARLIKNIQNMQAHADRYGKAVRPHAKTHKCTELAKLQRSMGAFGICVTKPSEALVMAKAGINGLLLTSPVVTPIKIATLMQVLTLAPDTMVVLDNIENIKQLNAAVKAAGLSALSIIVDIDAGIGRTGVGFDGAVYLALKVHQASHLELKGVQCYAGHFQHIQSHQARLDACVPLLKRAGAINDEIAAKTGLTGLIQTGSGTGSYEVDCQVESVTEIQPGSYTVMDQEYFDIDYQGQHFLPAMTLLTSVISANHSMHVTVDAGLKALYKDPTPPKIIQPSGLHYDWDLFGDEHGKVTGAPLPKIGDVLEMIVPHCDPTINLFDRFYIIEDNEVADIWPIDLRGKSQ